VLDESEPLEEHPRRPTLSRVSPATQTLGTVDDKWLRVNLVAIAQLTESLDRALFELAFRIVSLECWRTQLPKRPRAAENDRSRPPTEPAVSTRSQRIGLRTPQGAAQRIVRCYTNSAAGWHS